MKAKDIQKVDRLARSKYTYEYDAEGYDRWESFADQVLAGAKWEGDCDDLSSTVCDLLGRYGQDASKMWFANVDSKGGNRVDHMIAFALDDAGKMWVVGDTFGSAYAATSLRHTLVKYCRLDSAMQWYGSRDWRSMLR